VIVMACARVCVCVCFVLTRCCVCVCVRARVRIGIDQGGELCVLVQALDDDDAGDWEVHRGR